MPTSHAKDDDPDNQDLWEELEETPIEVEEFDSLFSRPQVKPKAKKEDKKESEKKSTKIVVAKLLDAKRSQNVGIFIKSKHLQDIIELENTIYNFDNSVIDFETLSQVKANQASSEELIKIKDHMEKHPDTPLDFPEQFLLELSGISNFNERLECFMFQTRFADSLNEIENKLHNVKHVCDMFVSSNSMKQVVSVVLSCGNYMNGGNIQRGQADGFNIDILPKLKDVKSRDNTVNLLQYVVRFCILKFDPKKGTAEAQMPIPEPSDVEKCVHMNFEDQAAECNKLTAELERITKATEKVVAESEPNYLEPFQEKMNKFLEEATGNLKDLNDLIQDCSRKFIWTMKFFRFKPKDGRLESAQPKDFFCIWLPFCQDYKNFWKREQLKIEKELLKEERMRIKLRTGNLKDFKVEPRKPSGLKEKYLRYKQNRAR
jgi:formin 2